MSSPCRYFSTYFGSQAGTLGPVLADIVLGDIPTDAWTVSVNFGQVLRCPPVVEFVAAIWHKLFPIKRSVTA